MATPNMDTITASLERSLQNCSLNHHQSSGRGGDGTPHRPDSPGNPSSDAASTLSTAALELNSQASLPVHWEQCLDLKTGGIYFINWRTGMKATEDPRSTAEYCCGYYTEEDACSSYDSDGSSSESSPSGGQWIGNNNDDSQDYYCQENVEKDKNNNSSNMNMNSNHVLVVAGCKSCLMYYMVPKQLEICPKCCGQLLHFDRSENGSP